MAKCRHWKQRFCSDDEFVFFKRVNLDGTYRAIGDPVDKGSVRPMKLRMLWRAGCIQIANWIPPGERIRTDPVVEARGQGWYHVHWRGVTTRLRGKEAVEKFLSEAVPDADAA